MCAAALLLCVGACTRSNPEFGLDDETDGEAATASVADHGDDQSTSRPSSTTRTDGADDHGGTDSTDDGDTEAHDDTGEVDICHPHAPAGPFVVKEYVNGQETQPQCGATINVTGMIQPTDDGRLTLIACDGECVCGNRETYGLAATLHPSPADLYQHLPEACVSVTLNRATEAEGCFVRAVVIADRSLQSQASWPRLVAANELVPQLTNPSIELGELLQGCREEDRVCARAPGRYALRAGRTHFSVGADPEPVSLSVGESTGDFIVQALRASVDASCESHVSWTAVASE